MNANRCFPLRMSLSSTDLIYILLYICLGRKWKSTENRRGKSCASLLFLLDNFKKKSWMETNWKDCFKIKL